jgi:cell division septum initiation protein DivIVA
MPQLLDDNEDLLSQSEAAETKLEEERTKVARSHPLYQENTTARKRARQAAATSQQR